MSEPEPNEPSKTESEATSQEDDLDTILGEWPEEKKEEAKASPKQAPAQDPMLTELYSRMAEDDLSKAVERAYSSLEDLPAKPDKSLLRDILEGRAQRDPRIGRAWQQRHSNPDAWMKTVDGITNDVKKRFEVKESQSTSDVESAMAVARGSSIKEIPPEPVSKDKLGRMTDQEFAEFTRKEYGI